MPQFRSPTGVAAPEASNPFHLHLFQQQPGFVDRGHEVNNKETAWVNGFLFRLQNDATAERLSIEEVGSSVDKISALR